MTRTLSDIIATTVLATSLALALRILELPGDEGA